MNVEFWMPPMLALLAAVPWFMSMVAGSFVTVRPHDTLKARMWYGCSIVAVEFLVIFGWMAGRYIPLAN